jgi:hypothetical protein
MAGRTVGHPGPGPPAAAGDPGRKPGRCPFLERARAAKPAFALTDANAAPIAEIVHRLDGLPLALELAAARLRALSPSQLRDRLGHQLDLLFGPSGDRPDRQQTLRAAIRWSHDLLSPEQKALFRRLGVFAGGFSLEAAETLGGELGEPSLDPLDGVEELLTESLLRAEETPDGELRYRMLETIRAYALERLEESGEEAAARPRTPSSSTPGPSKPTRSCRAAEPPARSTASSGSTTTSAPRSPGRSPRVRPGTASGWPTPPGDSGRCAAT